MLTVTDIPLNCLVPSDANVRRTGQSLRIGELAASIQAHGLLQNLTVRIVPPEKRKAKKKPPYEVIAGGRRLAALKLLAKRKQIAGNAAVPCHVLTDENVTELSLAENALQCPMHPADQFDAFFKLHNEHGLGAEDIAARFGVTAPVVKQRLKLAAVSSILMQAYRDAKLSLDQLTAFAVTDDHARQEEVWEQCHGDEDRADILAALNEEHVAADDRRARFVGCEAYVAAGGAILRDLFDDESEGFLTDPDLLNQLVEDKLETIAGSIRAEGWKWIEVLPQLDYGALGGMRRLCPKPKPLSPEDQAKLDALETDYDSLTEDDEAEAERLEQEIEALRGEDVFQLDDIAIAGAIISLGPNGQPRIERGLVRREDEPRKASGKRTKADGPAPLSAALVAELTAHKTLALRDSLGQRPDVALIAVTHALADAAFFPHDDKLSCLGITARSASLSHRAPGIGESPTAARIAARHRAWAERLPETPEDLWEFVAGLDEVERMGLLAHCAALTIDAVRDTEAPKDEADRHAERLAEALAFDMRTHWRRPLPATSPAAARSAFSMPYAKASRRKPPRTLPRSRRRRWPKPPSNASQARAGCLRSCAVRRLPRLKATAWHDKGPPRAASSPSASRSS